MTRRGGGSVLVLEAENIPGPPGRAMEGDPRGEQHVVALVEDGAVVLAQGESADLGPPHRLRVTDAAVAVLEVGLEGVGHLAGPRLASAHPLAEFVEEPLASLAPVLETRLDDGSRQ